MKNREPLVSIVTVVLNGRDRIERSIESVAGQKYKNLEYVVIDGGSTDGTLDLLKKHDSRIDVCVSEPDHGIAEAFNKGIQLAKGDVIGILNAGDWYEPEVLAAVADTFRSHPDVDVVCGAIQLWNAEGPEVLCRSNPERLDKETSVYHPTVFVRRSAYDKFGLFDLRYKYAMDYELLLRYKRSGAIFRVLNAHLANMELDGLSSVNWYHGLSEVRMARSVYFGALDVAYHHVRAIILNVLSRSLKRFGFRGVYRSYWHYRNQRSIQRGVQPKG